MNIIPTHWHSGHISGAGFLKVPSNLGKNKQQ
jgi:phosphoribosyl 1,2-cyclic phosphodiesterase